MTVFFFTVTYFLVCSDKESKIPPRLNKTRWPPLFLYISTSQQHLINNKLQQQKKNSITLWKQEPFTSYHTTYVKHFPTSVNKSNNRNTYKQIGRVLRPLSFRAAFFPILNPLHCIRNSNGLRPHWPSPSKQEGWLANCGVNRNLCCSEIYFFNKMLRSWKVYMIESKIFVSLF